METLIAHDKTCIMGKMQFAKEIRVGLQLTFYFSCAACDKTISLLSHPETNVNTSLVWETTSIGIGYAQYEEFFGIMDMPRMSSKYYKKLENEIGNKWKQELQLQMTNAAEEERAMAIGRISVTSHLWSVL